MSFFDLAASSLEARTGLSDPDMEIVRLEADLLAIFRQVAAENNVTEDQARMWLEHQADRLERRSKRSRRRPER